ncbi:unnamed protein product [Caenorhabditis brenneri]
MSHQLHTSHVESPSAAAISVEFNTDLQTIYDNVDKTVDFTYYDKNFYQYLQNLHSKSDPEKTAEKTPKFVGDTNDSAYVKKCFRRMAEDIKTLDVDEYLASVQNSLLTLKLKIHDIERKSDELPVETLQEIHEKKEKEYKASIKTYTEKLEKTGARFYFLQNCVIDNFEMCSNQISELISTMELSEDARMQYATLQAESAFLKDATKFLEALRAPCKELSAKIHQQITRPAEEGHEHLFVTPYKERPTVEIITDFVSRCSAVQKKWSDSQFRGQKCKQYLDTAYRFINSVHYKTDHFIEMSRDLDQIYCNVGKDTNERIFIKLALDKKEKCIKEMKIAEQLIVNTNKVLDGFVETDTVFQPSTSSSSAN